MAEPGKKRNDRKRDLLADLVKSQKGKCHWCKQAIQMQGKKTKFGRNNYYGVDKSGLEYLLATVDHLRPKSFGGRLISSNCVASCGPCNVSRGNRPGKFVATIAAEWIFGQNNGKTTRN